MAASATTRAKAARQKERAYKLTSWCQVCDQPIVPGQTWKFTPEGGKVHYYCAKSNPGAGGETLKSRLTQEGGAIARQLHPHEWDQPVSRYYILEKWKHVIPGYQSMTLREKREAEGYLISAYLREAKRLLPAANPARLDLSWLQVGDTFAPSFGGQMLKRQVILHRNSDGRELTVSVEDVLAFNSEPVRLSAPTPYRYEVGIWATPIASSPSRRGFLRDTRYSLIFEGVPGYAYGEKWRLRHVGVENPAGSIPVALTAPNKWIVTITDATILPGRKSESFERKFSVTTRRHRQLAGVSWPRVFQETGLSAWKGRRGQTPPAPPTPRPSSWPGPRVPRSGTPRGLAPGW